MQLVVAPNNHRKVDSLNKPPREACVHNFGAEKCRTLWGVS
jgi:hypothetical protein